ncbi:hypothetical protein [Streptomyces sp. NPDC003635]
MTGTGPVEPVNSPDSDASYEVIGVDPPRLTARVSPRARATALVVALTALATAGALLLTPDDAGRPEIVDQAPWPANVTTWDYLGAARNPNYPTTSGSFRFDVSVARGSDVTVRVIGAAFAGLRARSTPRPEFTVPDGTTRRISVEISVSDCSELPLNADLPFLDVTLRNARAIQHHSFIFGGAFSRDLSDLLRAACDPIPARPGSWPTGSAGSQNAD